jgi:hypothetical protein
MNSQSTVINATKLGFTAGVALFLQNNRPQNTEIKFLACHSTQKPEVEDFFIVWGGVSLSALATQASSGPIVPVPDDK